MATVSERSYQASDLHPITRSTLNAFRRRRAALLLLRAMGVGLLSFVSLTLLLATIDYLFFFDDSIRWGLSVCIYIVTLVAMWTTGLASFRSDDPIEIAKHVESVAPEMREHLVSAVELSSPESANGSPFFRRLLQDRVAKRIHQINVRQVLPIALVRRWLFSGFSVAAFCIAMMFIPSAQFGRRFARAALPGIAIERASKTKVTIIQPSPQSGYVAQRDAVAVIAIVDGVSPDDVMLHWRSDDGTSGESPMTPRVEASAFQPGARDATSDAEEDLGSSEDTLNGLRFAANLSVGSVPIHYRVTAGDAITLWYELTPLPRPRVTRYEKRYLLPAYAKLGDRMADEEHGDLKALQGTTAEVTVTFDQPVENPVVRFGIRGSTTKMIPVDEGGTKYLTRISIKTSGQYQVDATSVRSGLNNPFSPSNMITPVLDTPPVVRWSDEMQSSQMVSALDVIDLAAFVSDDLPLQQILQEVRVNEETLQSYALAFDPDNRKSDLKWSWDLMNRLGKDSKTSQLSVGDVVQTRLVAIDRRGARSETDFLEFLIAGDGFDADRHDFLELLATQTDRIESWASATAEIAKTINEVGKGGEFKRLDGIEKRWQELQRQSVELIKEVSRTLSEHGNPASASLVELTGRSILDIESRLDSQLKQMLWLSQRNQEHWQKELKRFRGEVGRAADQTAYQCQRLAEFEQARFSLAFLSAMYADVIALKERVATLVDDLPRQRLPRYITLLMGQIAEIDRLLQTYDPHLSPQTSQHLSGDNWLRWSSRSSVKLDTLLQDRAKRDQVAVILRSLQQELDGKPQSVIHSGVREIALRWGRDLRKENHYLADLTRRVRDAGQAMLQARQGSERDRNAEDAIEGALDLRWAELRWETELQRLIVRASGQEKLNRAKTKVDLKYAADQNLFIRAVKNVTENGFQAYKDESPEQVFDSIGRAIAVLQACGDLRSARVDWLAIRDGESLPDGSPIRKIYHPLWFKLQDVRIELAVRYLRTTDLDWEQFLEPIDQLRHNNPHALAESRLDSRQWRMDPFISAASPLESLAVGLQQGINRLDEQQQQTRQTLRRYVLRISEQATEAAKAAEQARSDTDQRPDDSDVTARDLDPTQKHAIEKATETIGALIDQANTSDIVDDQQREIARDADAAAELIADAVRETKEALKQVDAANSPQRRGEALEQAEQTLGDLRDRLKQTAEHFEKIENEEDVSQTRQQLRAAEQELEAAQRLDQRYEQAEQMAETAQQDPRELLRKLEQELQRNEPMQEALSDISARTLQEATKALETAARDENDLQRKFESDDQAFAERKRQQQLMLDEFLQRTQTLRDRTLATTSQAASWANDPDNRKQIEQLRSELTTAIDNAQSGIRNNATLNEIQSATNELENTIRKSAEVMQQAAKTFQQQVDNQLHGDDKQRDSSAQSMQKAENRLRNDELGALNQQRKKWASAERDAGRRIQSAEQKRRQAESAIKREQGKLQKDPDNDWIQNEIQKQSDRRDESQRTAEQSRRTKDLARERGRQADARGNELNRKKSTPLDKPNPAAQLGQRLSESASERMNTLADELQSLSNDAQVADRLENRAESASDAAEKQQSIENDVQSAADDIERSARHEERLGNQKVAEQLSEAAEQIESMAGQAAQRASDQLDQATKDASLSSSANQAIAEAEKQIAEQAKSLASLLDQSNDSQQAMTPQSTSAANPADASQSTAGSQPQSNPATPSANTDSASGNTAPGNTAPENTAAASSSQSPNQSSPQQMAQTLDELDRSLAAQNAQANSQQSTDGQATSSQNGEQADGQTGSQSGQSDSTSQSGNTTPPTGSGQPGDSSQQQGPSPANAIDLSPTLAEMLESAMQQAAKERMQSLQQAQNDGQPGPPNSSDSTTPNPISESGEGEPGSGPDQVDLLRRIDDGDWGDLRRRGVDDASQGRSIRVPPGYSKEIQAYFKALSKRAAEDKNE